LWPNAESSCFISITMANHLKDFEKRQMSPW
jgi:hypothetical protein